MMRLARYIAQCGITSRRNAELLIRDGLVRVNGTVVTKDGTSIDPHTDTIVYRGKRIVPTTHVYYMLNKPLGYVCTMRDRHHDALVVDLVPSEPRVYPVGRLDKDSEGLIILTNDGDIAQRMIHPKHQTPKIYDVVVDRQLTPDMLGRLQRGVRLSEGVAKADQIRQLGKRRMHITIHQGWNRQIRRMLDACGYRVVSLTRIAEGSLKLGNLSIGTYKKLSRKDFDI